MKMHVLFAVGFVALGAACVLDSGGNAGRPDDVRESSPNTPTNGGGSGGGGGGGSGSEPPAPAPAPSTPTPAPGSSSSIPGGGTILFQENFDNASFGSRGWYDGAAGTISTAEHAGGSTSSFQCNFAQGASGCSGGTPARHKFTATESVYLRMHMKFSANWVGSGKPYHPHMIHFLTDADGDYVGYANTHLTAYAEVVWQGATGTAALFLQDTLNVDTKCVLLDNDTFVGCNGNFKTFPFTENRSVCSCNGLAGNVDQRGCFSIGGGMYYSSRGWRGAGAFTNAAGPASKNDWHVVEVYFQMNSIKNGIGVPDGKIRWVQDGKTLIAHDDILLRTGAHPTQKFVQFAIAPYIGDGSPVAQSFWLDDITVATARP